MATCKLANSHGTSELICIDGSMPDTRRPDFRASQIGHTHEDSQRGNATGEDEIEIRGEAAKGAARAREKEAVWIR